MNEVEFRLKYETDKRIYEEWGSYVTNLILNELKQIVEINTFLKIEPKPRVKNTESIIEKAFYRPEKIGKYKDPYNDIEDKVGVRFVVLLVGHINIIREIIEKIDIWSYSKDKDFEQMRDKDPNVFDYQSVHYVVKNKCSIDSNGINIPSGTPCEVQIRTLLQHAHSELTHDTLYKAKADVSSCVKRISARSMALIETADFLFEEVNDVMHKNECYLNLLPELEKVYKTINPNYKLEKKINILIIDTFTEESSNITSKDIIEFLDEKSYIKQRIVRKIELSLIYQQPVVLLLYYLIYNKPYYVKGKWPLQDNLIRPLYSDLGERFD